MSDVPFPEVGDTVRNNEFEDVGEIVDVGVMDVLISWSRRPGLLKHSITGIRRDPYTHLPADSEVSTDE